MADREWYGKHKNKIHFQGPNCGLNRDVILPTLKYNCDVFGSMELFPFFGLLELWPRPGINIAWMNVKICS